MRLKIETSRLILRPFALTDAEAAFGWFGNPVVMRFTPSGPDTSIDQTKTRLARYQEHQIAHGFSKWIILDRSTGRSIGDSGLLELQDYGWIDLGLSYDNGGVPELKIYGYAYDDTGALIQTAVIPEPAPMALLTLGALALGAKGLRTWRRNRNCT